MANVLNVLLAHQRNADLLPLLGIWRDIEAESVLLIAHGGAAADYEQVSHTPKIFIEDARLRTRDHQREYQSITGVLKTVHRWMYETGCVCEYIHLAEYDHLPLVPDLNQRQVDRIRTEDADVLAFHLHRIDGTSHPHYLYHSANPQFGAWLRGVSLRADPSLTLSMLGTGSFWTREAFEEIATRDEPFPVYFEVYLPTLAHHLGFRLRDWAEQNPFVLHKGDRGDEIDRARQAGAWTLHPVKTLTPATLSAFPQPGSATAASR